MGESILRLMHDNREINEDQNDLSRVVDELPALIWSARADGYCDFFNRRWSEYTGAARSELSEQGWLDTIHPQDQEEFLQRWNSILVSDKPDEIEARVRRSDGKKRWFLFRVSPRSDATGRLSG